MGNHCRCIHHLEEVDDYGQRDGLRDGLLSIEQCNGDIALLSSTMSFYCFSDSNSACLSSEELWALPGSLPITSTIARPLQDPSDRALIRARLTTVTRFHTRILRILTTLSLFNYNVITGHLSAPADTLQCYPQISAKMTPARPAVFTLVRQAQCPRRPSPSQQFHSL